MKPESSAGRSLDSPTEPETGPIVAVSPEPVRTIVHEQPIYIVKPVVIAPARHAEPEIDDNPRPTLPIPRIPAQRETIPVSAPKQFQPENNVESIPNNSERVPKSVESIPESAQNVPEPEMRGLDMPEVEDDGEVGRKRKYDDTGIYGDISIKDVVLFRHIKQRHFPDLSADMREWYEHFYFKVPVPGEPSYRGKDYEQHKRAYERGQRWIAAYDARDASTQALGDSGATIIPISRRANG
jgi:hypothetical protein